MKPIHLVSIGEHEPAILESLRGALADEFRIPCVVTPHRIDPMEAFHPERQQFHSTELIAALHYANHSRDAVRLGVASVDLYIPILTFVFGEAQVGGQSAVVSSHRLRQEFYGLRADRNLMVDRLIKESVHELGHTQSLIHCEDYRCVMAASHSVEWIDVKGRSICQDCRRRAGLGVRFALY
jgi:archaemetzincin